MNIPRNISRLPFVLVVAAAACLDLFSASVRAQTAFPTPAGHADCEANAINDSLGVVGGCVPANANGSLVATYASSPAGAQTILQALSPGRPCVATGLPNNNAVIGSCENAGGALLGVVWLTPASAPVTLAPLPALKGALTQLFADVSSMPTAYNENGAVVGASTSVGDVDTAVLWPPGTGSGAAMVVVSTYGDNCEAVDVNGVNINGRPTIALNCPAGLTGGSPGTRVGKVAINNALLGGYQLYSLPIPANATNCTVSGINDALQLVGTCRFANQDSPQTAYWASPGSAPKLLVVSDSGRNEGHFINAGGKIAFSYQKADGDIESGFWNPAGAAPAYVPDLPGGSQCEAVGLGDNDTMVLDCENANEQQQVAKWTASGGTVALGYLNGGTTASPTALNKSGTAASITGEDSQENEVAGYVGL